VAIEHQAHLVQNLRQRTLLIGCDDLALWHRPQPSDLALGELAGGDDAQLSGIGNIWRSRVLVQGLPHLPITYAAHGRQFGVQIAPRPQAPYLVDKALLQHRIKALGNAVVQPSPVRWF
jgi:hypothetical protein